MLIGLEFKAFKKLVFNQIKLLVEFMVETIPVSFFALTKANTVLNTDSNNVNRRKGQVATTSDDTIRFWEDGSKYARTATHGCDFGAIITFLVIL